MINENNRCVRMEFEFDNGDIRRLRGGEAQAFLTEVNNALFAATNHGVRLLQPKWESSTSVTEKKR